MFAASKISKAAGEQKKKKTIVTTGDPDRCRAGVVEPSLRIPFADSDWRGDLERFTARGLHRGGYPSQLIPLDSSVPTGDL